MEPRRPGESAPEAGGRRKRRIAGSAPGLGGKLDAGLGKGVGRSGNSPAHSGGKRRIHPARALFLTHGDRRQALIAAEVLAPPLSLR